MKSRTLLASVCSVVVLLCTLYFSWGHQWQQQTHARTEAEQQLLTSLSLMVEPLLARGGDDHTRANLLSSMLSSSLPIQTIWVSNAERAILSSSHEGRELPASFFPSSLTGQQRLEDDSEILWSTVRVSPSSYLFFDEGDVRTEGDVLGYVILQLSPATLLPAWYSQTSYWLICVLLLGLQWGSLFFRSKQKTRQVMQGIHSELNLLLKKNVTTQPAQIALEGLHEAIRELGQNHHELRSQLTELQLDNQASRVDVENLRACCEKKTLSLACSDSALKHSQLLVKHWQQQLFAVLQLGHEERQLQLEFWKLQLLLEQEAVELTPWQPRIWLKEELQKWQGALKQAELELLLIEDPALSRSEFVLDSRRLSLLCNTIFQMVCLCLEKQQIAVHLEVLQGAEPKLRLQWGFAGQCPALFFLQGSDSQDSLLPVQQLLKQLIQQANYQARFTAVADLASSLVIDIPLQQLFGRTLELQQTLAYVDALASRSVLLKPALSAVAEQVICLQSPAEFERERKVRLVDLVVVQLPNDRSALQAYQAMFSQIDSPVIAYASATDVDWWQTQLACQVIARPLQIHTLLSYPKKNHQHQQPRLLVVDDNETNLAFVRALMAKQPVQLETATTGQQAIRLASTNHYELILMDIQLPDEMGTTVAQQIRQLPHHQKTLIFAFTAHALPSEREEFMAAGMDDVVIKPLDVGKIAFLLQKLKQLAAVNLTPL